MRGFQRLAVIGWCLLTPAAAYAQASIAGTVRDASGAVLPGVTVEASSPALIEKVRSVVTDGDRSVQDHRSAARARYSVTFTLTGFNTIKRDGIELAGSFAATVNADLMVGSVAETITVSGEAPTVDSRTRSAATSIPAAVVGALPTGAVSTPWRCSSPGRRGPSAAALQDVGGTRNDADYDFSIHGSRAVRPAPHGQRAHRAKLPLVGLGQQLRARHGDRSGSRRSTTRRGRPTRSAAAWASTSSRRKAATGSWGRSSSRARTARFRGTTTRDELKAAGFELAKRAATRLRHQPVGRRADLSRQSCGSSDRCAGRKAAFYHGGRLCQREWRRSDEVELRPGPLEARAEPVDGEPQRECASDLAGDAAEQDRLFGRSAEPALD